MVGIMKETDEDDAAVTWAKRGTVWRNFNTDLHHHHHHHHHLLFYEDADDDDGDDHQ